MNKNQLRSQFLEERRTLSDTEVSVRSTKIASIFFQEIDLSGIGFLHVFLPIPKNKEPDTWMIIDGVRRNYPSVSIVIPRMVAGQNIIEHYSLEENDPLTPNHWGIPEPALGEKIESLEIDMVLVPLLCFDMQGQRVGYGKGFYDRFLKECTPECQRIGLSMFEGVDRISDADEWDVPLHQCITPSIRHRF